jgi:hypothetical protein
MASKYKVCGSVLKHNEVVSYIKQYPQKKKVLDYLYVFDYEESAKAMMISELENDIGIIDSAIKVVPLEFRKGVLMHFTYSLSYDDTTFKYASRSTWDKWRKRFLDEVIKKRGEKEYCDILFGLINA